MMNTETLTRLEQDANATQPTPAILETETLEEAACRGTIAPCEETIRQRAYERWQAAGCPQCDGLDFWLEAERDVTSQSNSDNGV